MSNCASKSACAELDRENAHFSVSEAMIAAIEETRFYKWKRTMEEEEDERFIAEDDDGDSDEEVRRLKMKLRAQHFTRTSSQPIFPGNLLKCYCFIITLKWKGKMFSVLPRHEHFIANVKLFTIFVIFG